MSLPGLGRGEVAEDLVLAQAAAVVEDLDEVEDLGAGSGPVGPDPGADFLLEQGPETLRGGVDAPMDVKLRLGLVPCGLPGWLGGR